MTEKEKVYLQYFECSLIPWIAHSLAVQHLLEQSMCRSPAITDFRGNNHTTELNIKAVLLRNVQSYANCTISEEILTRFKKKINNKSHQIIFTYLSYSRDLLERLC
jgi:hypothetical protein